MDLVGISEAVQISQYEYTIYIVRLPGVEKSNSG